MRSGEQEGRGQGVCADPGRLSDSTVLCAEEEALRRPDTQVDVGTGAAVPVPCRVSVCDGGRARSQMFGVRWAGLHCSLRFLFLSLGRAPVSPALRRFCLFRFYLYLVVLSGNPSSVTKITFCELNFSLRIFGSKSFKLSQGVLETGP